MAKRKALPVPPPSLKVENWPIDELHPYPGNPRKNVTAIEKVARSIKEFGFQQPIVVDPQKVIVVGHTRWEAAKYLQLPTVPVVIMTGKSAEQIRAYRLADNRVHEESLWDEEALIKEIQGLADAGADPAMTGFSPEEIKRLIGEIEPATLSAPPDSVQENADHLSRIKQMRDKGTSSVDSKRDTEHYLVVVFPDRLSREAAVQRLGLPADERYVDAQAIEIRQRVGGLRELRVQSDRATTAASSKKSGATG